MATLGTSFLGHLLARKVILRADGRLTLVKILNLPRALTSFEMQKCYQSEPKFNSVFSRNNLPKIKEWTYLINLDKYKSIEMHCIVFYLNGENVLYICSFGV